MTITTSPFQLGEAVEHRGIVITPLFPTRDPVAAYITLDEALPRGLTITETVRRRLRARARRRQPARRARAALRRRGARRRKAEPDPQRQRARRCRREVADPGLLRGAGPLGSHARSTSTPPGTSRTRTCAAARPRCSPHGRSRAGSRRARCGTRFARKQERMAVELADRRQQRHLRGVRDATRELEDAFPLQPGQCGAVLALGDDLCLDWVSRPDAFASLWPKLRAGYLLDALERLDQKPTDADRIAGFVEAVAAAVARSSPSAGLGHDVRLRGSRVIGSGLELDGELLQLSAFTTDGSAERAFGRIARPSRTAVTMRGVPLSREAHPPPVADGTTARSSPEAKPFHDGDSRRRDEGSGDSRPRPPNERARFSDLGNVGAGLEMEEPAARRAGNAAGERQRVERRQSRRRRRCLDDPFGGQAR